MSFFFVKQKTAYEMRISDWSSDVCSSDLRPEASELEDFVPEFTIIALPSFRADPARHGCRSDTVIAVNLTEKMILIGGTRYAGEMKKSVFGVLNYQLPPQGVMPMHCSANIEIGRAHV